MVNAGTAEPGFAGGAPDDGTTRVQRFDTNPDTPVAVRTSYQFGTVPASSACCPGASDATCALWADALARTMTRLVTSGPGHDGIRDNRGAGQSEGDRHALSTAENGRSTTIGKS